MVITMEFYTVSHNKFPDKGYSDILYRINSIDIMGCCTRGGGTSIETLYGDVPPKWVGFLQKIPKHGPIFDPKSLNMGPFCVKITKIFWARNASPENFQKIPKHGSIFWAKSLNMGTFFYL